MSRTGTLSRTVGLWQSVGCWNCVCLSFKTLVLWTRPIISSDSRMTELLESGSCGGSKDQRFTEPGFGSCPCLGLVTSLPWASVFPSHNMRTIMFTAQISEDFMKIKWWKKNIATFYQLCVITCDLRWDQKKVSEPHWGLRLVLRERERSLTTSPLFGRQR